MNAFQSYRAFGLAAALAGSLMTHAQIDRSSAPNPSAAPKIELGTYDLSTLDNGLTLIVVENHRLPLISWNLTLDMDPVFEGTKAGYVNLAGSLMSTGTKSKSKAEIDEAVDFIGGRLRTSAGGAFASSLSKHSDALLALFADVILHPAFPEDELEKARNQSLSGLQAALTNPSNISANMRAKVLHGNQHPYGEVETPSSIEAIERVDLVAYHQTYFRPNIAYLVVVGDITPAEAREKVQTHFGSWEPAAVENRYLPLPASPEGNQVCFAHLPGAVQSVMSLTHLVDLKPGHPDAIAVSVMNSILGGGAFSGRLMQNLREDKAFTYGARSSISPDRIAGDFNAFANVRNEVTDSAVVEFLFEIERMTTELVDDQSLQTTLNYMTGSFARSLEQPETVARFALNTALYDLPADYYATYLERLNAVQAEDVLRMAKKYLRPNNLYITIVGNQDEVAESLVRFDSDGTLDYFDPYGAPARDLDAPPAGMTALTIIEQYYTARGGAEKFEALNSLKMMGSMEAAPGMSFALVRETIFGKGTRQSVSMGGAEVMAEVVNSNGGITRAQGGEESMDDREFADAKEDLFAAYLLHLEELGLTATLAGIDNAKATSVAVVLLEGKGGKKELRFDLGSGLLVEESTTREGPLGSVPVTIRYSQYESVKGLQFPKLVEQIAGGQSLPMRFETIDLNPKLDPSKFMLN